MGKPFLEAHSELESVIICGKFFKFGQENMLGYQRTHFDVRDHMHLRALLKNLPMRVFQVTSPNFSAISESWKHQSLA